MHYPHYPHRLSTVNAPHLRIGRRPLQPSSASPACESDAKSEPDEPGPT